MKTSSSSSTVRDLVLIPFLRNKSNLRRQRFLVHFCKVIFIYLPHLLSAKIWRSFLWFWPYQEALLSLGYVHNHVPTMWEACTPKFTNGWPWRFSGNILWSRPPQLWDNSPVPESPTCSSFSPSPQQPDSTSNEEETTQTRNTQKRFETGPKRKLKAIASTPNSRSSQAVEVLPKLDEEGSHLRMCLELITMMRGAETLYIWLYRKDRWSISS